MKNYFLHTLALFLFATGIVSAQDYTGLLKGKLLSSKSSNGMTIQDIEELTIYDQSTNRRSGVEHVYAVQKHNGIEIFQANIAAAFRGEEIVHLGDNLQAGIAARIKNTSPVLTAVQAATKAASVLGAGSANFTTVNKVSSQKVILDKGGVSLDEVPVKLVYQLTKENEFRLAWDLSIHMINEPHWYSVRIDAENGEMLSQHDWVTSCTFGEHLGAKVVSTNTDASFGFNKELTNSALAGEQYNVFSLPLENPNEGANQIVIDPQDELASPFGWHDIDGVEGAEFTITRGNNVFAHDDIDGDEGIGFSPEGGSDLNFDFEYGVGTTEPVNTLDAAITNLFYMNNVIHDIMYRYGFDEQSGNFQETNYTGEGVGGDSVNAQSQDGGGFNNANFGTPPEGMRPRMQMFLWSPPRAEAFITIDNGIAAGNYMGVPALFGDDFPVEGGTPLAGAFVLVEDNPSGTSDVNDACDPILNGAEIEGNIAVVRRGTCEFSFKMLAAQNSGAIGVIVVNNTASDPIAMMTGSLGNQVTIPSLMINQADGEELITSLLIGEAAEGSIVETATFNVDGSLDNGVIAHEYGHGISQRLVSGPSVVGCVVNDEAMDEGVSDYFGLMLTMKEGDLAEDPRGYGTFIASQPLTGNGIRIRPYSTDLTVNSLTYGDLNNATVVPIPHGIGTVWTTMIWDMTWYLIDEYGFDSDLYNGTAGNNIALQLVIDGLKLQPCNSGFVDARDAIIAAIEINTMIPEEDKGLVTCSVWNVFADRGLGINADQGSPFLRNDQVENFDAPAETDPSSVCFDPLSTDEFEVNSFSIYPNPSNGQVNLNMRTSLGEGQIQIIDLNGRIVFTQENLLEGVISVNSNGLSSGVYLIEVSNETISETKKLIIR